MCWPLTVKLHFCSHRPGQGDPDCSAWRRRGRGEVTTLCPRVWPGGMLAREIGARHPLSSGNLSFYNLFLFLYLFWFDTCPFALNPMGQVPCLLQSPQDGQQGLAPSRWVLGQSDNQQLEALW